MLKLTNTLGRKLEEFKPISDKIVGMYNCGPTVYDYAHIGNLRSYVFADILRRTLEWNGFEVKQIINITDIGHLSSDSDTGEDKMTKGLKREGLPLTLDAMKTLADKYTEKFLEDTDALNIKRANKYPKASEHIKEEIELVEKLEKKGFTYKTSDGIYFDTGKDKNYGKLGGLSDSSETRVGENNEKKSQRDFALWKFNDKLGLESPWGKGFPGWHIECSAMSMKYLGETFDIHTGGIDHIPVHHNNEIAQSENATGKTYANYWLHNAFVNIGEGKMAKSEGNFLTINTLRERNISPIAYRYWLFGARYSSPMNFTFEALENANNAYKKLVERFSQTNTTGKIVESYVEKFGDAINDDLDTPKAVAVLWELIGDNAVSDEDKKSTAIKIDEVLGLGFGENKKEEIPENIIKLATARDEARKNKNWNESDRIRDEIANLGFEVKDTDTGPKISKK